MNCSGSVEFQFNSSFPGANPHFLLLLTHMGLLLFRLLPTGSEERRVMEIRRDLFLLQYFPLVKIM